MKKFGLFAAGFKGLILLEKLIENAMKPGFVVTYTQKGDVSGAQQRIDALNLRNQIPCVERSSFDFADLANDVDVSFAVGWQYLENEIPRLIVLHDSVLPRYRGFAPVVSSLLNGEPKIGVTAIRPTSEVDAGPICAVHSISIDYPITIETAFRKNLAAYLACIYEILSYERFEEIQFTSQTDDAASYSIWLSPDDQLIDWSLPTDMIVRQINAFGFPYSGAKTRWEESVLTVREPVQEFNLAFERRQPGKVWRIVDGNPIVLTGDGLLRIQLTDANNEKPKLPLRTWFH